MNQMMQKLALFIMKIMPKQCENLTIDILQERLQINENDALALVELLIKEHVIRRKYTYACPKCTELNTIIEGGGEVKECQFCSATIDTKKLISGATIRYVLDKKDFVEFMQEEYRAEYESVANGKKVTSNVVPFSVANNDCGRSYNYDVAVICALSEELDVVKNNLNEVREIDVTDDDYIYYEGTFDKDGAKRRVIMAQLTHMGMVPAATLTTRLIYNFTPKYIVMTGIAAGIDGKVNFGDVIAAEYTWDYGAGKDVLEGDTSVHRNTIQQIHIDTDISTMVRRISSDKVLLSEIKEGFNGEKPETELKIVMGPIPSGAAVVANPNITESIKNRQIRDVVGIEMEIFGVYYAARWSISPKPKYLALKAVCDYADERKNDVYHKYASYTSARVFLHLAKDYFEYDKISNEI